MYLTGVRVITCFGTGASLIRQRPQSACYVGAASHRDGSELEQGDRSLSLVSRLDLFSFDQRIARLNISGGDLSVLAHKY